MLISPNDYQGEFAVQLQQPRQDVSRQSQEGVRQRSSSLVVLVRWGPTRGHWIQFYSLLHNTGDDLSDRSAKTIPLSPRGRKCRGIKVLSSNLDKVIHVGKRDALIRYGNFNRFYIHSRFVLGIRKPTPPGSQARN